MSTMTHGARELLLFAKNDSSLHRQREEPILKNLALKKAKGEYSHEKAVKLWMYWADDAAQRYCKEFGSSGDVWHRMFPPTDRKQVAEAAAKHFEVEYALGNYDHLLPKKYQPETLIGEQAKESAKKGDSYQRALEALESRLRRRATKQETLVLEAQIRKIRKE